MKYAQWMTAPKQLMEAEGINLIQRNERYLLKNFAGKGYVFLKGTTKTKVVFENDMAKIVTEGERYKAPRIVSKIKS